MLQVKTPAQVQEDDAAKEAARFPAAEKPIINFLAGHVKSRWEEAKFRRHDLTQRLLDCHRRRRSKYDPGTLAKIKAADQPEIFMGITGAKCNAAKAWLEDLFSGDRMFTADPTPISDLPPNIVQELLETAKQSAISMGIPPEVVKQLLEKHRDRLMDEMQVEAEKRAERMSDKIEDVMTEGRWQHEFSDYLNDLVTYPFAVIKGLEFSRKKSLKWKDMNGLWSPVASTKIFPTFRRVSPFRFYFSGAARHTLEGHWSIEHHTFSRQNLSDMRGSPGYDPEAIANVLIEYGFGGLRHWVWSESEVSELNNLGAHWLSSKDQIDGLEYSGSLSGKMLIENGMSEEEIPDPYEEYQVSILVVGSHVIRALVSADPAGDPDYMINSWESVPGSLIGVALPERLSDTQDMCNAAARALAKNMGLSSGPMVGVWSDQLKPGTDVTKLHPQKIFYFEKHRTGQSAPIEFFQPQSNAREFMEIYERFSRYGDEISGMPSYAYGSDQAAGAGKTASGLSMLMNAASKNIKDVVRSTDMKIIEPSTQKVFNHLMLTDPDQSIKGDLIIKARGSLELVHKEQKQMRDMEMLGFTNNATDMQIMGLEGRTELLREAMRSNDRTVDRILPTKEQILEKQAAAMQQPQEQQVEDQRAST